MASIEQEIKQKQFNSPYQRAIINIIFTGNWLTAESESKLKAFGISQQQYNVLRILRGQQSKAINLCDIQERMMSRMSNATRLVEKLRQAGYVTRELCQENRRKVEIAITEKGLELLEQIEPGMKEHEQELAKRLSEAEVKELSRLLDKARG